jgi:hypothetical protein
MACKNCGPTAPGGTQIDEMQPSMVPAPPEPRPTGGPTGIATPGVRTRDFVNTWDTAPSVMGPMGKMNVGYVHNVVSTNGQWSRGDIPDMGYGYTFALRRPKFMREPRTDLGTYNFAKG